MIRRYCDACEDEITAAANCADNGGVTAEKTFRPGGRVVRVTVQVTATVAGTTPDTFLCRNCVIDTVKAADTRGTIVGDRP